MSSIHFICRDRLHVHPASDGEYESGNWAISSEQADTLVGGRIYLHQKKKEASYLGGRISGFRVTETSDAVPSRIVFRFKPEDDARGRPWRGDSHPRAWTSGPVSD